MSNQTKKQPATAIRIKIAVLLVIVFCTAALLAIHLRKAELTAENKQLQQQSLELEEGNQDLEDYIAHKDTDEGVNEVAKEELGMVDPDTIIYDFD